MPLLWLFYLLNQTRMAPLFSEGSGIANAENIAFSEAMSRELIWWKSYGLRILIRIDEILDQSTLREPFIEIEG